VRSLIADLLSEAEPSARGLREPDFGRLGAAVRPAAPLPVIGPFTRKWWQNSPARCSTTCSSAPVNC
jgi:hypothetical protein